MELLPIIYVSLAIFAIVSVVTIITSFVSYKVREKTQGLKKPYEREEDPSNNNYMKKKLMDADGKFHTVVSDKKSSERNIHKKQQPKRKSESKKDHSRIKSKPGKKTNRIEILNKPEKINLPNLPVKEEKKSEAEIKNAKENIIDKYTNDKEEEFFSPKISANKKTSGK